MSARFRSPWAKVLLAGAAASLATGAAWLLYRSQNPAVGAVDTGEPDGPRWRGDAAYVVDAEVGHRAARNVTVTLEIGGLGTGEAETTRRRANNLGFVAVEDVPEPLPSQRVLMLGDSHTMGVVSTADNAGPVLQRLLRAVPGQERAVVMNAGTGFYSLYQYTLRARQLLPRLRPQVMVVVVFLGNDLLELEDVARPHLDDALAECRPSASPPPETTSERLKRLALPAPTAFAFWQGLNQAAYLHLRPERVEPMLAKARRALELLDAAAKQHGARPVLVLLPSFDLVFPARAAAASTFAREVVTSGAQQALHDAFAALARDLGLAAVDLLPVFRADARLELYATDFHIWKAGHRAVAEQVLPIVTALLPR